MNLYRLFWTIKLGKNWGWRFHGGQYEPLNSPIDCAFVLVYSPLKATLNDAAPQNKEEQQEVFFRLKKELVDTLVEKVNTGGSIKLAVPTEKDEIYTRIFDLYRAGQVLVSL